MDPDAQRKIRALRGKIAMLEGKEAKDVGSSLVDVEWYEKQEFIRILQSVPRTLYTQISDRQFAQIDLQAKQFDLPITPREPVNLLELVRWFHDYLAKWGKLNKSQSTRDGKSAAIAAKREAMELQQLELKLKNLEADFIKKSGNAISSAEVDQLFSWYESELRKLGERLGKRFGAESQELFNNTLDRISRHLTDLLPQ